MAIPFSRSIRSMNHDRYLPGLIGIFGIGIILILWIAWFFGGHLSVYETSSDIQTRDDGMLLVKFPETALQRLAPGQQVELNLTNANPGSPSLVKGEVMNLPANPGDPVEIFPMDTLQAADPIKGQMKVLVGSISPALMIWQSIGN